jgi:hypothetical protein
MKAINQKSKIRVHAFARRHSIIMIKIQKDDNWETPEGCLSAVYKETRVLEKVAGGKVETILRPVFQVTSLASPRYNYLVAKNYRLSEPQKFKADFENWLGDSFYDLVDADGTISREALDSLVGKKADLQMVHIPNDGHKAPFSHLVTIAPLGSLVSQN